jgi:hypothetical protein
MRWSIGIVAVMVLAAEGALATPVNAQQIQEAPLPSPPVSRSPEVAQSPQSHMTTQDCVQMPTPAEQTDCLNRVASEGNYMPTAPAPNTDMPMEFRLPLGTREVAPSR